MNVVLLGLKGAGKTTVGPLLAERLGFRFDDLDRRIERAGAERLGEALTFREVFRRMGEEAFRAMERELLGEALAEEGLLLALGGGAGLDPASAEMLRAHCVVLLRAPEADLLRRIREGGWPAYLDGESDPEEAMRALLARRLPRYAEMADVVVENPDGAAPEGVAREAAERVRERLRVRS